MIARLAGIESLVSGLVADRMIAGRHRPKAQPAAQRVAHIGSARFAGRPAAGAIARTATHLRADGDIP
ncbi:hypothetical protein [Paracoccus salsus]|uniref:hypothetical protein n=1 Tax=Paracoccus salsus TaxID=2911061 RepID=UPI001F310753|nr:hypothetical protein [Paracoccus salsus]MCF3972448.1 hypothetical protein [Paracoccus salsus]